jgi:transcriptional regulator with XRE-family HTH domain
MRLKLREVRERRWVTQTELAERTGLTVSTISRLEQGHQRPRISTVRKLAEALDINTEDLVEWAPAPEGAEQGKAAA